MTVLRTLGRGSATKTYTWNPTMQVWAKRAYAMGRTFTVASHEVDGIQSLGALVERIKTDASAFIIRGELHKSVRGALDPANHLAVFRRYLAKPGQPQPDFIDVPRQWLCADFDGWEIPDGLDLVDDVDMVIERAITELLPPQFHDVTAFWQLSSSAGFAPGILKAHVWFWLDRPIETLLLKRWMKLRAPGADGALFNPIQIHYTAAPIINGGADPVPKRTGWVQGERDTVTLPDMDADALGAVMAQQQRQTAQAAGLSPSQATTVDGALAALGDGEGLDGFHDPLRRAVWLYARQTAPWARDAVALKARLRSAILAAPFNSAKRAGVGDYLAEDYLDRLINGAFEKIPDAGGWETVKPTHTMPVGDAAQARQRMRAAIRQFLENPMGEPTRLSLSLDPGLLPAPRRGAALVEVGLGKTAAALVEIADFIEREKAAKRPPCVLYFVPEHKLGTELMKRAQQCGIAAVSWYGRDYVPPGGKAMCDDPGAVKDAIAVAANVGKFVCGPAKDNGEPRCVHYDTCRYQAQRGPAAGADMIVLAQAGLFHTLVREVGGDVGLVVIDEAFWQIGLGDSSITLATFAQDALQHPVLARNAGGQQVTNETSTNDLHAIRAKLLVALDDALDGYLEKATLQRAGLTAEDAAMAGKLEWQRQVDNLMYPGMASADRKKAAEVAAINGQLPRLHGFWTSVRGLLEGDEPITGRVELAMQERASGSTRVALVRTRRDFSREILNQPILMLDATGSIDVMKEYLPTVELLVQERPECPHMTVRQIVGGLSKTSLHNRPSLVQELRDFVVLTALGAPALVITHLEFEEQFEGLPNVQVAHFGAIAGRDEWGRVRHLFTIGRPQPNPTDTRLMASQLTGRPVPQANPARATAGILMADGSGVAIEVSRFDDPDAEGIRAAVCDAAIVQAVGRGRGVNRTEATPLDVWVMGDVVTPWPVTEIKRWSDVALRLFARMAARGLVLENAADMAAVYPDLYPSRDAAKKARQREEGDIPLLLSFYKGLSPSSVFRVRYRPQGAGQKNRVAWVATPLAGDIDAVRIRLENVLGPLALFESLGNVSACPPTPEATVMADQLDPIAFFPPAISDAFLPPGDLLVVRRPGCRDIQIVASSGPLPLPKSMLPPVLPAWVGVRLGCDGVPWPPWPQVPREQVTEESAA